MAFKGNISQCNISAQGDTLCVNGVIFKLSNINYVDVVPQEYPLFRKLSVIAALINILFALIAMMFSGSVAVFFIVCCCVWLAVVLCFSRKYALRIVSNMGTTKVLISTDRDELEHYRTQILEIIMQQVEKTSES